MFHPFPIRHYRTILLLMKILNITSNQSKHDASSELGIHIELHFIQYLSLCRRMLKKRNHLPKCQYLWGGSSASTPQILYSFMGKYVFQDPLVACCYLLDSDGQLVPHSQNW
jgi:hypothetical protein